MSSDHPTTNVPRTARDVTDLLKRVADHDREAFSALYKATSAKLYGVISRILTRGAVADEVLQDVYVKIWEKAASFNPDIASPITWMATIARNRALDEVRRAKPANMPISMDGMPDGVEVADEVIDPLASRERSEDLQRLLSCLDGLEDEKRQMVLLAYYRGMSRDALSKRFGRPVPTIKTWLHRSLSQLRGCLSA